MTVETDIRSSIETDIRIESKDILTLGEALEVEDGMLRWFASDNTTAYNWSLTYQDS